MIYRISGMEEWEVVKQRALYEPRDLQEEGFIHACLPHQVEGVRERWFRGVTGLRLLEIDESKLTAKVIMEKGKDVGDDFPHVYGPINVDAIVSVTELP